MALSIKNDKLEQLARRLAEETGESITQVIRNALEQQSQRLKKQRRNSVLMTQLEELLRRVDAMPTLDSRSADEILGYDDHGMPR